MISMIWAMDETNLIGSNNKIPWHVKEDLIYFKNTVKGYPVVMGYNNYISMKGYYPNKKFPYFKTYVISQGPIDDEDITVVYNIEEILKLKEDIFIVGGAYTYKQFYPYADRLYISYIQGKHEGDTYIDFFNLDEFELVSENKTQQVRYTIYNRRK